MEQGATGEKHRLMADSSKILGQGLAELPFGRVSVHLNWIDDIEPMTWRAGSDRSPWTEKETDDENPQ